MYRYPMLLIVAASLLPVSGLFAQQDKPPASPVVTAVVTEEVTPELKTYVGTVLPLKRAVVGSAVDGRVVEMHAEVGDRVEAGGQLAQLLTETIELELEAAEAELALRKEELRELEAGSRPEELEQAEAKVRGAKAMMDFTQARAKRNEKLYRESQGISPDEVEESLAMSENASQTYAESRAAYDLAVRGPREERKAQASARVAMQEAMVQQTRDRIRKHTMISRFAGYVVSELAEEGQWVTRGDPVAEVVALDRVEVEVHVVEQSINLIRLGSTISIEIPSAGNEPFEGKVSAIVPQADVRSRTFPVRILVSNKFEGEEPIIKSGMYARAKLPTGGTQKSKLVPKDALVLGGPQPVVYVVEGGKVKPVPVELGGGFQKQIQVIGALQAGQQVVVVGNERLRPGQEVKVIRTMEVSTDTRSPAGDPERE